MNRVFYCNGKKGLCYDNEPACAACEYYDNSGGRYVDTNDAEAAKSGICKNGNNHIREKLVELFHEHNSHYVVFCDDCFKDTPEEFNSRMYGLADHLIANGVTVQEWIPVTERLPEKPWVSVLVHMPDEKPHPTVREGFLTSDGIWHSALYDREPDEVTYWMPLPTPPKGE